MIDEGQAAGWSTTSDHKDGGGGRRERRVTRGWWLLASPRAARRLVLFRSPARSAIHPSIQTAIASHPPLPPAFAASLLPFCSPCRCVGMRQPADARLRGPACLPAWMDGWMRVCEWV